MVTQYSAIFYYFPLLETLYYHGFGSCGPAGRAGHPLITCSSIPSSSCPHTEVPLGKTLKCKNLLGVWVQVNERQTCIHKCSILPLLSFKCWFTRQLAPVANEVFSKPMKTKNWDTNCLNCSPLTTGVDNTVDFFSPFLSFRHGDLVSCQAHISRAHKLVIWPYQLK